MGSPRQHPVGLTSGRHWFRNAPLQTGPAEWFSPTSQPNWWNKPDVVRIEDYKENPPVADGRRVSVPDTDHLWGHGGNPKWVWKCFTRGHNPIFMDPWQGLYLGSTEEIAPWSFTGGISKDQRDYPDWEPTRRAMGDTRRYAQRMNLAAMTPRPELCFLALLPRQSGRRVSDLSARRGQRDDRPVRGRGQLRRRVEWFLPQLGRAFPGARPLPGGDYAVTIAPYTGDAVLYLKKAKEA